MQVVVPWTGGAVVERERERETERDRERQRQRDSVCAQLSDNGENKATTTKKKNTKKRREVQAAEI